MLSPQTPRSARCGAQSPGMQTLPNRWPTGNGTLPDLHADPADRIILATGVETGSQIVSKDSRFSDYRVATIIW